VLSEGMRASAWPAPLCWLECVKGGSGKCADALDGGSRERGQPARRKRTKRSQRSPDRISVEERVLSGFYPTPSIVGFHSTGGLNCAGVALRIRGFKAIQARGNAKQSAGSSPAQIC
jgi:hypothetical protein